MSSGNSVRLQVLAAVVAAASLAAVAQAAEEKGPKEQCFGIAKAGENACASANGSHACMTLATVSFDGQEFVEVPKGTCEKLHGSLKPFAGVNPKL